MVAAGPDDDRPTVARYCMMILVVTVLPAPLSPLTCERPEERHGGGSAEAGRLGANTRKRRAPNAGTGARYVQGRETPYRSHKAHQNAAAAAAQLQAQSKVR